MIAVARLRCVVAEHASVRLHHLRALGKDRRPRSHVGRVSLGQAGNHLGIGQQGHRARPGRVRRVALGCVESDQDHGLGLQHLDHLFLALGRQDLLCRRVVLALQRVLVVQEHHALVDLVPPRHVALGPRQFQVGGHAQKVRRHIVNALLLVPLVPQPIEQRIVHLRDIRHTRVVAKDLEGSQVDARLHLYVRDSCSRQLVCNFHRVLLRSGAVKVVVGHLTGKVVELVLGLQQIVDGRAAVAHDPIRPQERLHHLDGALDARVLRQLLFHLFELLLGDLVDLVRVGVAHC